MPGQAKLSLHNPSVSLNRSSWVLSTRHGLIDMRRRTAIMGILNITPDSFSDGGRYFDPKMAIARGVELAGDGADIIDIGGESTRPGSLPVSVEEEIERVIPVIRGLRNTLSIPISIDTYKADVARRAIDEGVDVVNDISALRFDPGMVLLVAKEQVPVVLMHMQGIPRSMHLQPHYHDVVQEVTDFLRNRVESIVGAGVDLAKVLIDPGIGFGKNLDHNLTLLRSLSKFSSLGGPVLVGPSRKTFIGLVLKLDPEDRLEGSLAAAVAASYGGANMIRVHDVKGTFRALKIADTIRFGASVFEERNGG